MNSRVGWGCKLAVLVFRDIGDQKMDSSIEFFGILCVTLVAIVAFGNSAKGGSDGHSGTANKAIEVLKSIVTRK